MSSPESYEVHISTPKGDFYVEVPTFQGADVAERRARMAIASQFRTMDLAKITVVGSRAL